MGEKKPLCEFGQMSVNLCASVENEEPVPQMPVPKAGRKIISLADFL